MLVVLCYCGSPLVLRALYYGFQPTAEVQHPPERGKQVKAVHGWDEVLDDASKASFPE